MKDKKGVLDYVSEVDELFEIHKFMEDENVDTALALVVKLTQNPEVTHTLMGQIVTKLQSLSAEMQLKAKYYTRLDTTQAVKKDFYYTLADVLDKLAAAVKHQK